MKELDEIIALAKAAKEDAAKMSKDEKYHLANKRFRRSLLQIKDIAHHLRLVSLGKSEI